MFLIRFLLSLSLSLGLAAILWTQTGPFAWIGGLQLALTDSYSVNLTLALTLAVLLLPVGAVLFFTGRIKPSGGPNKPGHTGMNRAVACGGLLASALVVAFGLAPLFAPRPAVPPGELRALLSRASLVPAQAELSLTAEAANIDLENTVTVTHNRYSTGGTIYAPVHAPGSTEVLGMVSGTENEWRNASIRALPFANEANAAALTKARDAILTLQPVPLIVRRQWAEKNLPVPLLLPAFQWGRSPLAANLPLIVGGGTAFIAFFIALVRSKKIAPFTGRPADM